MNVYTGQRTPSSMSDRPDLAERWRKNAKAVGADRIAGQPSISVRFEDLEFADDDFLALPLQYEALGMIQRSERKRAVSDKASYWTLTEFGRTRLRQLRATKRDEPASRDRRDGRRRRRRHRELGRNEPVATQERSKRVAPGLLLLSNCRSRAHNRPRSPPRPAATAAQAESDGVRT